jgi:hypothetical protein
MQQRKLQQQQPAEHRTPFGFTLTGSRIDNTSPLSSDCSRFNSLHAKKTMIECGEVRNAKTLVGLLFALRRSVAENGAATVSMRKDNLAILLPAN